MKYLLKNLSLIVLSLVCWVTQLLAQSAVFPKEITVAQDGSGNYQTIQEAVNSVRDLGGKSVKIFIKKGIYKEKLVIPTWKTNISLIGEDKENTIITNNDFSGKVYPQGKDAFGKDKFTTYTSYTVLVQGNDLSMENLTIANTAGAVGQAVALHVEGDRFVAKNCKLLGFQDTLYAATEKSRQFYQDCYIEGTTDFIFGEATAVFQNYTINSLSNSYVTAAATRANQKFGFVLFNCTLKAVEKVTKVYLGRPWRPYAKTVFINCELGSHITSEGWNPWKGDAMFPDKEKTAYYAEFGSKGPGAAAKARVAWSHQLNAKAVKSYTLKNILGSADNWDPLSGI
ncbi:pectinesterase family protein [Pedobacter hiemivivus]|uniref:Pectinesterase n=1 Tax=Pedobacter hiemivivus TaxID=2530454 RepID=A0A4R0MYP2_9SPHI|nr:pectinesterase family protein [Pedobacter hiemivivus]TCC92471.1 pectin esterase [Pedobacter hiemivivus]